jgi:hypothetical protein
MVALAATSYAYARVLGIGRPGSAMAALSFTLCGFQAIHDVHEPFTGQLPYLPLCLLLADRYATTGRWSWLAGLALAWGTQVTLGHFQIQMWTAGLVLLAGGWRAMTGAGAATGAGADGTTPRPWRILGLAAGLAWGAAIAWVQLRLTWELVGVAGFIRPAQYLAIYAFPPAHWAQLALPEVFLGRPLGVGDAYWGHLGTTPNEACAYVGVVPVILAFVGFTAGPRDRALTPWRLIGPLSLAVATMPGWWPDGYFALMQLPGLGWFRAPARYTLLTSFALALLAGRGLDEAMVPRRIWAGLGLAIVFGAAAWAWTIAWARGADFRAGLGAETLPTRFAAAGLAWGLGLAAIAGWRLGRVGAWAPWLLSAMELGPLLFLGPIWWDWSIRLPDASPLLRRLADEPGVGLVGGRLNNLPVYAGRATAYPTLGIVPPPPNYLLEPAVAHSISQTSAVDNRWQRRFGVTHGVWGTGDDVRGTELLAEMADPALDRVMGSVPILPGRGPWKLVRNRGVFPSAWVASRVREAPNWPRLYSALAYADLPDEAWILVEDRPPALPEPTARSARVQGWDGRTATVEHDGSCILVLRRTHYPGWVYSLDGGPEQPVLKVNAGLQGVPITGAGTSRVEVSYHPTGLARAATVSLGALMAAVVVVVGGSTRSRRRFGGDETR